MLDVLFRDALIVDGSGAPAYRGDLAVEGERIAAVGRLPQAEAATVVEAHGRALAPGFVDVHVHSELEMLAGRHTAGVQMGVTTELICPDGMSFAPLGPGALGEYRRYLRAIYGEPDLEWDWRTTPAYLARFAGRIRNNIAPQAPHGAIRLAVKGWAPGPASEEEIAAMGRLAREWMEAGAAGLNTGLEYAPAIHADLRELVALSRVVAEYGGVYAAHLRSYDERRCAAAVAEAAAVGQEAGVAVHISHFARSPSGAAAAEEAIAQGVDLTWDAYPYTAGCTMLAYGLPPELLHTGIDQLLQDLARPEVRAAARPALDARFPADSPARFASLSRPHNRWMEGLTVREAAARSGRPFEDFVCALLAEEELAPLLILPWAGSEEENEAHLRRSLTHPRHMLATDGIYAGRLAHPRAWGSYPRVLGRYVREKKWLSLEDAVRRLAGLPAERFGLAGRGLLRPGYAADLVLFDAAAVADRATYDHPRLGPVGIEQVLVNGVPVVLDGALTPNRPGRVLRRG